MVRAGSPGVRCHQHRGHNLSFYHQTLSIYETHQIPKMWLGSSRRQYPPHENIPDRFYFIVRVRPYHCIHYCSTEEEGGSGPGLINILLSRFPRPALMPTLNMTPDQQDQQPCIIDCWFRIYVIGPELFAWESWLIVDCRVSSWQGSENLCQLSIVSLIYTLNLINWNKDGWS